jgi:peptidoglycan/LPS O-acetylase OafA/YrhL
MDLIRIPEAKAEEFQPANRREEFGYVPAIDGLRAVAVVSVMLAHLDAHLLPGGFAGVDVFFVISGLVVTASLQRDLSTNFPRYIASFYARRIIRILPALLVMLVTTALLTVLFIPPSWLSSDIPKVGLAAFYGWSNVALVRVDNYFSPRAEYIPFTHTWSLSVEEQFYLIFPLLLFLAAAAAKWGRARTGSFVLLVLPIILSFGILAVISPSHPEHAFYSLPARFWELGLGALLFLALREPRLSAAAKRFQIALAWIGVGGIALAFLFAHPSAFPFPWAIPAVLGALSLSAAAVVSDGSPCLLVRLLAARPVVFVGLISYALYLWHWVVYTLARWTIGLQDPRVMIGAVLLSVALASLSTFLLERPLRRSRWLLSQPKGHVIGTGLAAAVMGYCLAWIIFEHRTLLSLSRVQADFAAWYGGVEPVLPPGCRYDTEQLALLGKGWRRTSALRCGSAPPPDRSLFVAGDSHATAYGLMTSGATRELGLTQVLYHRSGCPLFNLIAPPDDDCAHFGNTVIADIVARSRPGDVVFLASLRLRRAIDQFGAIAPEKIAASEARDRARGGSDAALAEASKALETLQAAGLRVIIDLPKPMFPAPAFRCVDWFNRSNPDCGGGLRTRREAQEKLRASAVARIDQLVDQYPALIKWDALPLLCDAKECSAISPSGPLFLDGDHLTAHAQEKLMPSFTALLREVLGQ